MTVETTGAPASIKLEHRPSASSDPYIPAPGDRMPFLPAPDQDATIYATTAPIGAASRVWVSWNAGVLGGEAEAQPLAAGVESSNWQATLPAFGAGERIEYQLHAVVAGETLDGGQFSYTVPAWRQLNKLRQLTDVGDRLVLTCSDADGGCDWNIELGFTTPSDLRIRLNFAGGPNSVWENAVAYTLSEEGTTTVVSTGTLRLEISHDQFSLRLTDAAGQVILAHSDLGLRWLEDETGNVLQIAGSFLSPNDEAFFGFGERFNAFNQRGNTLDVRVYEQYKQQGKRTYMPVPFFVSSAGYGLFLDTASYVTYDLAATAPDRWSFGVETTGDANPALDMHIFTGTPKSVIGAFTARTARPALPPDWIFTPWMSGNEWNSQAAVMEQVRQTVEHDIPAGVMVIEAWSDESTFYIWNDAEYTPRSSDQPLSYGDFTFPAAGKWPDPKAMIDQLHELGIKLILWQIPVMKKLDGPHTQHDLDESYMLEQGYHVRHASGEPYHVRPIWFRGSLVADFANEAATQWWLDKRAYLLDELGVDGFKTDGGEHLAGQDLVFADGSTGTEALNRYPLLYTGAYSRFATAHRNGEATLFSRAGFTGSQAFPCHWAGDEDSTWPAFRASITAGLTAGASGVAFWGWDIAGFSGEIPTAELYLRGTAMAVFCPIMQYHSEYNDHRKPSRDRSPWNIQERTGDGDVIAIYRQYARLRLKLLPYIKAEARRASETGIPMMRALPVEYPADDQAYRFPYQYLFGEALLVAPVVEEGATSWDVYLPAGEWINFWSGETVLGSQVLGYPVPKGTIPVFIKSDQLDYFRGLVVVD